jgi:hypothetical protein
MRLSDSDIYEAAELSKILKISALELALHLTAGKKVRH